MLSDTEGEICAFFTTVSTAYLSNDCFIKGLVKALPTAFCCVKSSNLFTCKTQFGGIINDHGDRYLVLDVCSEILSEFSQSGFSDEHSYWKWLIENLPFSRNFSLVQLSDELMGDKTVNIWEQASFELRFNLALEFHKEFPELEFEYIKKRAVWSGQSSNKSIRIESIALINSKLTSGHYESRCRSLNRFNEVVNSFDLNWDERLGATHDEICSIRKIEWGIKQVPGSYGILSIGSKFSPWPQDQFVVRKVYKGFEIKLPLQDLKWDKLFRDYCKSTFESSSIFSWNPEVEELEIPGGNMHVSGNLVFIGRDSMDLFDNTIFPDEKKVGKKLLLNVFGTTEGKNLIWLGVPDRGGDMVNKGFQPVYHTDLFFQPLGFFVNDYGKKVFYYIFAKPSVNSVLPELGDNIPECLLTLFSRFESTQESIKQQLAKIGIESEAIIVPFPLRFKDYETPFDMKWGNSNLIPYIDKYWSFTNGLVNKKLGETEFIVASYLGDGVPEIVKQAQKIAHEEIKNSLNCLRIIPIEGKEFINDKTGGLRCRVKVLARSFKEVPA